MPPEDAGSTLRFIPTADRLDEFFRRYEEVRHFSGMATTLERVSPRQRVDTIVAILGLNVAGGWKRREGDSEVDLWLRYLTPVLAETRQSALALAVTVRGGLPGAFEPPFAPLPPPPVIEDELEPWPEEPSPPSWRRKSALMAETLANRLRGPILLLVGLAIAIGLVAWLVFRSYPGGGTGGTNSTVIAEPISPRTTGDPATAPISTPDDPVGDDYRAALTVVLAAVNEAGGAITPRALSAFAAGESDVNDEPADFLASMLRRWPLPPDAPIAPGDAGRLALEAYAMAFVATERGAATPMAAPELGRRSAEDLRLEQGLAAFATSTAVPAPAAVSAPATWPGWVPLLAFLPLAGAIGWGAFTFFPALKAALTNPDRQRRGTPVDLPLAALVATAPPPARRLARQISWREPGIARRLNAERSVAATIRRGGFLTLVPRLKPRPADYLFLVPRLRREDHQRDRVSRFIEALARGGLALDVYDYDPDPRTLHPRARDGSGRADSVLDLRALRERHSEARLVLVTDGAELVDYFTQRPHDYVAGELALWPARMLLTPVPFEEWGEREMNLADALGALVGRATPEGFRDLATAFGERPRPIPRPRLTIAEQAAGERGLTGRIVAWLGATERLLGAGDGAERRPTRLRFDDPVLTSDAEPPAEEQAAILAELREWLDPEGYQWLVACTAYPELRFAITLYLGLHITISYGPVDVPLYDERRLAALSLLPWFRIGRMPLWLRKALMASLAPPARQRIRQAVDDMLNGAPLPLHVDLPEGAHLPIWRPEADGAEIPFDAVMADLFLADRSEIVPMLRGGAFSRVFREHLMRTLATRYWIAFGTAVWCAGAWIFWPSSTGAPHPAGAFLPLLAYVGASLLVGAAIATLIWLRRRARATEAFDGAYSGEAA